MRETRFIQQMKEKWKGFEDILKSPYKAPEKLYDVFINIMNDLSYARTFYPNRSVRVYLNGLAQQIFVNIYKNKKSYRSRFITFWTDDLPQLVYEARREFLLAFAVFMLSFLIGVLSSAMDTGFAEVILGESYVEMTRENIASGDPMAVYKQKGELGMSLGIAGNNLYVAFLTFVLGLFFTVGAIGILARNGIMVGAFQYFFIEEDLFWESFLTIWIHGTLEISAIIIAGAAGITMGKGLVFPGSFSRAKAFQKSARRGIKIMIGIAPIIILAAFFEGYLTRNTGASFLLRGVFITVNLLFILGYFVFYPRWKAKLGFNTNTDSYQLQAERTLEIEWLKIKNAGQIFGDSIVLFRKYFRTIFFGSILAALLYTGLAYFTANNFENDFYFPSHRFGTLININQFFFNENWWMAIAMILPTTLLVSLIFSKIVKQEDANWQAYLKIIPGILLLYSALYFLGDYVFLVMLFLFPVLLLYTFTAYWEKIDLFSAMGQTFRLLSSNYGKSMGLFLVILLISLLFFGILDTTVFGFFFDMLSWVFPFEQENLNLVSTLCLIFFAMTVLFIIFSLFFIAYLVFYFSALEAKDAIQLKKKIEEIGATQRIRGMERE